MALRDDILGKLNSPQNVTVNSVTIASNRSVQAMAVALGVSEATVAAEIRRMENDSVIEHGDGVISVR
jgi:Mn-dependent DtxR family transcriptional regulator